MAQSGRGRGMERQGQRQDKYSESEGNSHRRPTLRRIMTLLVPGAVQNKRLPLRGPTLTSVPDRHAPGDSQSKALDSLKGLIQKQPRVLSELRRESIQLKLIE